MKLNVKAIGILGGVFWALWVAWCVLMELVGIGSTPYNFVDEMYLGWLAPNIGGLFAGIAFGFLDGLIAGALFAWLYNKFVK